VGCDYISLLNELEEDHDHKEIPKEPLEEGERLFSFNINRFVANQIRQDKGGEHILNLDDPMFEEQVPSHYHKYKDVFEQKDFDQLPERRIWDH